MSKLNAAYLVGVLLGTVVLIAVAALVGGWPGWMLGVACDGLVILLVIHLALGRIPLRPWRSACWAGKTRLTDEAEPPPAL